MSQEDLDDDLLKELGLDPLDEDFDLPQNENPTPPKVDASKTKITTVKQQAAKVNPTQPKPSVNPVKTQVSPKKEIVEPSLTQPVKSSPQEFSQNLSGMTQDMPIQVVAVLGKKTMTLKDVINLKQGEVVELKKLPKDTIDLVANGKLLAKGELVLIDGKIGIHIKQLVN